MPIGPGPLSGRLLGHHLPAARCTHVVSTYTVYLNVYIYIYIWATVNVWYIAPSHHFLKSALSFFRFWCIRRKFRSQTSDSMERWKAEQGRGREKRKIRRKKDRGERVRRKKMQMREKVEKSRNTVFFQWFGAPEGRKVGSLKRRVRSQLARWEMKNCTPLWREAHLQVKMYKTPQLRTTFGSCDVEKVHAVVARSILPSQNAQNTPGSDHFGSWDVEKVHAIVARSTFRSQNAENTSVSEHFWKLRCRKRARRCGAKHISKSKCTKHHMFAPLLEVRMLKKCTPLWREAHFQVKKYKTPHVRATFEGSDVASLHYTTLHYPTLHSTTLHHTTLHYTTLHYTTLPSTTLHYITLHSTTLQIQLQLHNYTPLHSTTLNYTTLHYTTNTITLHYTPLDSTTLHYTKLHYTILHYITLHYTPLHSTTLNYATLHSTTLHYTTLHYTTDTTTTTRLHSTTLHYTK